MNKLMLALTAVVCATALGARAEPTSFVDVPSCHWASTAINAVTGKDIPAPAKTLGIAQNAVQQVFEGMKCGSADWVGRFVNAAPSGLADWASKKVLREFNVRFTGGRMTASSATLEFTLSVSYVSNGALLSAKRSGSAVLVTNPETGWKVQYQSLSNLNLPFFPK